ncbi:MAG: dTMP kinase [Chitinophagales bacterium]
MAIFDICEITSTTFTATISSLRGVFSSNHVIQNSDIAAVKARFIVFEGIDGSGKSTQARLLAEKLRAEGQAVHLTCEPTGSPIGVMIRDIFKGKMKADHTTIAGLFLADRLHHITDEEDGLLHHLKQGTTVISDRYYFSSYAYHSVHMSLDWVIAANSLCAQLLRPDAHIFLDMTPEDAMARIQQNRPGTELYETLENLEAVRKQYQAAFSLLDTREVIYSLPANQPAAALALQIRQLVTEKLGI